MNASDSSKADKLMQILESLVAQNYELRAQNYALREALVTFAAGVLQRPALDLLSSLEDCERYWHQWILEHLEDYSPSVAAMVDRRKATDIWIPPTDNAGSI